ncbi:MAG: VanZ family protein [Pseudomonadota bacterium]
MRHLVGYAVTVMIGLVVARLTLGPSGEGDPPFPHFDKVAHLLAFAALAFPLAAARAQSAAWIFSVGLLFGAAIEIIQPYVGRSAEWADLLADALGLILGIALGQLAARFLANR